MKAFDKLDVPYGSVYEKFQKHFDREHNQNILFTGKYGIGKTTFLKSFFEEKDNIILVRISPVNYAVSSNENIFELIKGDIIKQLFFKKVIQFQEDLVFDKSTVAIKMAFEKPIKIGLHLSRIFSKLNPFEIGTSETLEGISELIKEFKKFEKECNQELKFDDNKLLEYLESLTIDTGSYLEFNIISELISNVISRQKLLGKQTVLLVDDLDRLDPEHIFRILNVFSSHHDIETNQHKFGFDKIILACHFETLENIYSHRYGNGTDFKGYIDKFYSEELFVFSNYDALDFFLNESFDYELGRDELILMRILLRKFISKGILSMRQLIKCKNFVKPLNFEINRRSLNGLSPGILSRAQHINAQELYLESDDIPMIYIYKYFAQIFGSYEEFIKILIRQVSDNTELDLSNSGTEELIKALALSEKVAQAYHSPLNIYFKQYQYISEQEIIFNVNYPEVKIFNTDVKLVLNWSAGNRYPGKISFFSECVPTIVGQVAGKISVGDIIQVLIHIDKLLISKMKLELGIAS